MLGTGNFLRSDGGIELVAEVCLAIAEYAIVDKPTAATVLMTVSKSFYSLLRTYETSVTKAIIRNDDRLEHVNASQAVVLSWPGNATTLALTYEWYMEMRRRSHTIDYLVEHEICAMDDDINGWPTLRLPKQELRQRKTLFKRAAFCLLYELADCTAAIPVYDTHRIRTAQARFLDCLNQVELSTLGCMVEIIGQGFFSITKKSLQASPVASLGSRTSRIAPSESSPMAPSSAPWNDLNNDNWIRECMCVFEDRLQRYGPYFAWSYVAGEQNRAQRPNLLARSELQQGLDDMNAFELGYTMSYASLQSVVWKVFCKKAACSLADSWNEAKVLVEIEMAKYEV